MIENAMIRNDLNQNQKNPSERTWTTPWTKDFIYLVLLASWISKKYPWGDKPLDLIEYFAGVSRICKLASWMGYEARGFEILYDTPPSGLAGHSKMPHRSAFDFNGEAGFLSFDCS